MGSRERRVSAVGARTPYGPTDRGERFVQGDQSTPEDSDIQSFNLLSQTVRG